MSADTCVACELKATICCCGIKQHLAASLALSLTSERLLSSIYMAYTFFCLDVCTAKHSAVLFVHSGCREREGCSAPAAAEQR